MFSKDCAKELKRRRRIVVLQVGATLTGEDEPQKSVSRATFSSTVQPYLVDGTAVFVNRWYGCFKKLDDRFVYKRYYRSKSKSKAVLRVNYGDGWTVVL